MSKMTRSISFHQETIIATRILLNYIILKYINCRSNINCSSGTIEQKYFITISKRFCISLYISSIHFISQWIKTRNNKFLRCIRKGRRVCKKIPSYWDSWKGQSNICSIGCCINRKSYSCWIINCCYNSICCYARSCYFHSNIDCRSIIHSNRSWIDYRITRCIHRIKSCTQTKDWIPS